MQNIRILTEGDSSLLIEFGKEISPDINRKITATVQLMKDQNIEGVVDVIPAFCSLLINYDPRVISYDEIRERMLALVKMDAKAGEQKKRVFEIPVCYGGEYGPDLANVAAHAGLTPQEVVNIHTAHDYLIDMLGFLPGFAYLGGLDERLHTPRLATPRTRIEPGSVGIGGAQTGIYPLASPGGWQIIGRTPLRPYDPDRTEPILYAAGEYLRFVPITADEYAAIEQQLAANTYEYQIFVEDE